VRFRTLTAYEDGSQELWEEHDLNLRPATEEAAQTYMTATLDELNRKTAKMASQKRLLLKLELEVAQPVRKRAAG
jgi:hypothetical protein